MMSNIYIVTTNDSFVVYEMYGNNIINFMYPILEVVNKIRKEIVNESIRQKRI